MFGRIAEEGGDQSSTVEMKAVSTANISLDLSIYKSWMASTRGPNPDYSGLGKDLNLRNVENNFRQLFCKVLL